MITDRDIDIVRTLDESGGMDAKSLQQLFGMSETMIYRRLAQLERYGMVRAARPFRRIEALYLPTAQGVRVLLGRQDVRPPSVTDASYHHQIQVSRALGHLGAHEVPWQTSRGVRRRRIDLCAAGELEEARRFSIYLSSSQSQHLPDLLIWPDADRLEHARPMAVEVELSVKTKSRLDEILLGYELSPDFDGVLYASGKAGVTTAVTRAIERGGHGDVVTITPVEAFGRHVEQLVAATRSASTGDAE